MYTLQMLLNYVQLENNSRVQANNRRVQVGILQNNTLLKINRYMETNSPWNKEKPTTKWTLI